VEVRGRRGSESRGRGKGVGHLAEEERLGRVARLPGGIVLYRQVAGQYYHQGEIRKEGKEDERRRK
jgi:hypothetical protein